MLMENFFRYNAAKTNQQTNNLVVCKTKNDSPKSVVTVAAQCADPKGYRIKTEHRSRDEFPNMVHTTFKKANKLH